MFNKNQSSANRTSNNFYHKDCYKQIYLKYCLFSNYYVLIEIVLWLTHKQKLQRQRLSA